MACKTVKLTKDLFSKLMDKTSQLHLCTVIYEISCLNGEFSYIGQTARKLSDRLVVHRSDIRIDSTLALENSI